MRAIARNIFLEGSRHCTAHDVAFSYEMVRPTLSFAESFLCLNTNSRPLCSTLGIGAFTIPDSRLHLQISLGRVARRFFVTRKDNDSLSNLVMPSNIFLAWLVCISDDVTKTGVE